MFENAAAKAELSDEDKVALKGFAKKIAKTVAISAGVALVAGVAIGAVKKIAESSTEEPAQD